MGLSNAERQARWRAKRPEVIEAELTRAAERCNDLPDADRLALADKLADAAMSHLRRSQELAQLARRVRAQVMQEGLLRQIAEAAGKRACIALALFIALAAPTPTQAQDVRFRDAAGRTTGSARTDANGVTTFHDRAGRVTGTARTDRNGVTTFKDASGRVTGSIRR